MLQEQQEEKWINDIRKYCHSLNISINDLYKIVTDLKVSPMIRGKAFEFSTYARLKQILPGEKWIATKPMMNAQTGTHDIDIKLEHKGTGKIISIECKLAKKGDFKVLKQNKSGLGQKGDYLIPVKCMRSRTTKSNDKALAAAKNSTFLLMLLLRIVTNIVHLVFMLSLLLLAMLFMKQVKTRRQIYHIDLILLRKVWNL